MARQCRTRLSAGLCWTLVLPLAHVSAGNPLLSAATVLAWLQGAGGGACRQGKEGCRAGG